MLGAAIKSFLMWFIDIATIEFFFKSPSGFHLASKYASGLTAPSNVLKGMPMNP